MSEAVRDPIGAEFALRRYLPSDLDALFFLDEICFEKRFRFSRRAMRRLAEAAHASCLVAEAMGRLAGFCIVHTELVGRKRVAYLVTLDVAPEYRRRGVASALMRQSEAEAKHTDCMAMLLHVFESNAEAIRFYERSGYMLQGTVEDFYGSGLHALLYRKTLLEG